MNRGSPANGQTTCAHSPFTLAVPNPTPGHHSPASLREAPVAGCETSKASMRHRPPSAFTSSRACSSPDKACTACTTPESSKAPTSPRLLSSPVPASLSPSPATSRVRIRSRPSLMPARTVSSSTCNGLSRPVALTLILLTRASSSFRSTGSANRDSSADVASSGASWRTVTPISRPVTAVTCRVPRNSAKGRQSARSCPRTSSTDSSR